MPKKKSIVEGRTQQQRIEQRKQLGSLRSLTVQPKTRKRYDNALNRFFAHLRDNQLELPRQRRYLDDMLSDYLEILWSSGEGRALASDTLAGLQDSDPKLKGQLPTCWRLMKVWSQNEIPSRAPPMPESVVHALVGYAIFKEDHLFALSILLGFYGMMRTGEIIGLCRHQVEVSSNHGPAVLSLGMTKGGKRQGAAESITVSVHEVVRRLRQWKSTRISYLVPSAHMWRSKFSEYLQALGLAQFDFRPYSLRRGGATFWFTRHGSLDRLLLQGRWSAIKTAKIYINSGLATLAEMRLPIPKLRGFTAIYTSSLNHPLPSLEHASHKTRSTGGRGKGCKTGRKKEACEKFPKDLFLKLRVLEAWVFQAWRKILGSTFLFLGNLGGLILPGLAEVSERFRRIRGFLV